MLDNIETFQRELFVSVLANPFVPFSFILVFSIKKILFLQQIVHQVTGARIQTHNFTITTFLPKWVKHFA